VDGFLLTFLYQGCRQKSQLNRAGLTKPLPAPTPAHAWSGSRPVPKEPPDPRRRDRREQNALLRAVERGGDRAIIRSSGSCSIRACWSWNSAT
jgi:hypothetical protein